MPDSPISNKQLLDILKVRLSAKSTPILKDSDRCVIYDEYMDECRYLMNKAVKRMVVENESLIETLRITASACAKIEADPAKKVKRIPIINKIIGNLQFISLDLGYTRCSPCEMTYSQRAAVHSLVNQAKGYCKEAFGYGDFSMANTRISDAADILTLAQYIYKGDLVAASKHSDFDTIIREDISSKTWDWMLKNLNGAI